MRTDHSSTPFGARAFGKSTCNPPRSTKDGRTLSINLYDPELRAARAQAATDRFAAEYRQWRPMVERSIAWLVARGHRRVRFRGIVRNDQGLGLRVAAVNLRRLVNLGLEHNGTWIVAAT